MDKTAIVEYVISSISELGYSKSELTEYVNSKLVDTTIDVDTCLNTITLCIEYIKEIDSNLNVSGDNDDTIKSFMDNAFNITGIILKFLEDVSENEDIDCIKKLCDDFVISSLTSHIYEINSICKDIGKDYTLSLDKIVVTRIYNRVSYSKSSMAIVKLKEIITPLYQEIKRFRSRLRFSKVNSGMPLYDDFIQFVIMYKSMMENLNYWYDIYTIEPRCRICGKPKTENGYCSNPKCISFGLNIKEGY